MKILDLFSGSGSVAKVAENLGHKVITLDICDKLCRPDVLIDVLKWDYASAYKPGYFDFIWASPPCTEYSLAKSMAIAKHGGFRNLDLADSIVQKTLEILDYFQPKFWVIENPFTGLLKKRPFMANIPFVDVSYCQYGTDYRKNTRLWTNIAAFQPKICNKKNCSKMIGKYHIAVLGVPTRNKSEFPNIKKTLNAAAIPEQLLLDIFEACA